MKLCSGATWTSKMKNLEGSDPAHIAEKHGHKELKKIFEDFLWPKNSFKSRLQNVPTDRNEFQAHHRVLSGRCRMERVAGGPSG
ncbi:hypothetical protein MC885_001310, partial [Smutsia gigantea]